MDFHERPILLKGRLPMIASYWRCDRLLHLPPAAACCRGRPGTDRPGNGRGEGFGDGGDEGGGAEKILRPFIS